VHAAPRGLALGHMPPYDCVYGRAPRSEGLSPIIVIKWFFYFGTVIFNDFWNSF
jgi:hypothetical protein